MSLRESIEAAVNTVEEARVTPAETPVVEKTEPVVEATVEAKEAVKAEPKTEGRTAGRARDEHGRLLPGKAEKPEAKAEPKAEPVEAAPVVAPVETRPKTPPPSSWKKDHWTDWEKLSQENPKLAEYLIQREGEFAKGVSTYKQDFDRLKPVADVIGQYQPFLQQHNLKPEQFVAALAQSDQTLRFGTQQQKLQMFAKLAQDYQIPIQEMLVQGDDGKVYFNQQYFAPQQPSQQPGTLTRQEAEKLFNEKLSQMQWVSAIQNFAAAKDEKGNPQYPHFERVRQDMDGILRAGLAKDLPTAYDKAIRMHDDIWQAEQAAKQAAAQKAQQEAQAKQVAKAKATATSVRTATPSGETAAKPKGIRASLEAAIDARAEAGRV